MLHLLIYAAVLFAAEIEAIRVFGQDVTVAAGDDVQLFCQLDGLRDRVKFTGDISGLNGSILQSNLNVSAEGIYTCIFGVFPSGPYKTEIHLCVLVPPVVSVGVDVTPVAGNNEVFLAICTASHSKPATEVSWNLGDINKSVKVKATVIKDSEGRATVKSSLIGVASKDLNQKKVQCLVSHPGLKEKLELDYTLNIHYPPQVVRVIPVPEQKGVYQCEADANPKPTNFTWSRHIPVMEPLSSGVNGRHLTPGSNGIYYCEASNQYGKDVGSLYVEPPTECTTCWTLVFIALFVGVCVFLIWKLNLHQRGFKRLRRDPVPRSDPDEASVKSLI